MLGVHQELTFLPVLLISIAAEMSLTGPDDVARRAKPCSEQRSRQLTRLPRRRRWNEVYDSSSSAARELGRSAARAGVANVLGNRASADTHRRESKRPSKKGKPPGGDPAAPVRRRSCRGAGSATAGA